MTQTLFRSIFVLLLAASFAACKARRDTSEVKDVEARDIAKGHSFVIWTSDDKNSVNLSSCKGPIKRTDNDLPGEILLADRLACPEVVRTMSASEYRKKLAASLKFISSDEDLDAKIKTIEAQIKTATIDLGFLKQASAKPNAPDFSNQINQQENKIGDLNNQSVGTTKLLNILKNQETRLDELMKFLDKTDSEQFINPTEEYQLLVGPFFEDGSIDTNVEARVRATECLQVGDLVLPRQPNTKLAYTDLTTTRLLDLVKSGESDFTTMKNCRRALDGQKNGLICSQSGGVAIFRVSDGKRISGNQLGFGFGSMDFCIDMISKSIDNEVCGSSGIVNFRRFRISDGVTLQNYPRNDNIGTQICTNDLGKPAAK